jgi:hypothetical protein
MIRAEKLAKAAEPFLIMRRHKWPDETYTYIPSVERWSW